MSLAQDIEPQPDDWNQEDSIPEKRFIDTKNVKLPMAQGEIIWLNKNKEPIRIKRMSFQYIMTILKLLKKNENTKYNQAYLDVFKKEICRRIDDPNDKLI